MLSTTRNRRPGGTTEEGSVGEGTVLRRRCRALLTALDIRPPLDVVELCRWLARAGASRSG
jgi:hypothetical protein